MAVLFGALFGALSWYFISAIRLAHRDSARFLDFRTLLNVLKDRTRNLCKILELVGTLLIAGLFLIMIRRYVRIDQPSAIILGLVAAVIPPLGGWGQFLLQLLERISPRLISLKSVERVTKQRRKRGWISVFLLLSGLLECTLFNPLASTVKSAAQPVVTSQISDLKGASLTSSDRLIINEDSFSFYLTIDPKSDINRLEVRFGGRPSQGSVAISTVENGVKTPVDTHYGFSTADNSQTIFKITSADFTMLYFEFYVAEGHESLTYIDSIFLNSPIPFDVSALRVFTITGLGALLLFIKEVYYALNGRGKPDSSDYRRSQKKVLIGGGVALIGVLAILLIAQDYFFVSYPFTDKTLYQQNVYQQLFDSFRKGQFSLDIIPDPKLSIIDPYDPYARINANVEFLWDRAFYGGKYYIYYGITPLITTVFPLFFVTGKVALDPAIMLIGGVFLATAFILLLLELARNFAPNTPTPLRNTMIVVTLLASGLFTVLGGGDSFYHIPYIYGLAFMALFIYFALRAKNEPRHQGLYLLLSALAFVFLIQSRPNLCISLLFTIPIFLKILFRRERMKTKVFKFLPLVIVLGLGAAWTCFYNYSRFENVFEFGQFYQLTLINSTKLKLQPSMIGNAIHHFFLTAPNVANGYPEFAIDRLPYEYHPYIAGSVGALYNPFFTAALLAPFCLRKKDGAADISFILLIPVAAVLVTFVTYCYAGVCPRYIADYYPLLGLLSFIVLLKFYCCYQHRRHFDLFYILGTTVVSLLGIFFGISILFNGWDGLRAHDVLGLKNLFASLLNINFYQLS